MNCEITGLCPRVARQDRLVTLCDDPDVPAGREVVTNVKFREMIPELRLGSEVEIKSLTIPAQKAWAEKASTFVHTRVVSIEVTTDHLRKIQYAAQVIRAEELRAKQPVP